MGSLLEHGFMAGTSKNGVTLLPQNNQLKSCMTILRNQETMSSEFAHAFEKVARQLINAALDYVPMEQLVVTSPTGSSYSGGQFSKGVCAVSILRAGASMENAVRDSYGGPLTFVVFILEPMLATGGSATKAIEVIKEAGVPEENIVFVNVLASQHGLDIIKSKFPAISLVTAAIDPHLTASGYIDPGLGDFGDRFYGTLD